MPQEVVIWDNLTIIENLIYSARLQNMPADKTRSRTDYLIEALNLEKETHTLARNLSGGYKRRLNLALSIIHDPTLLFLDEPTPGIDAQSRRFLMDYIRDLSDSNNYAIVLTDHYLDEAEKLSDYVVIIDDGTVIAEGTVPQLKRMYGKGSLLNIELEEATPEPSISALQQELTKQFHKELTRSDHTLTCLTEDPVQSIQFALNAIRQTDVQAVNVSVKEPTLEDIFLLLTGKEIRE
ncbi:MAG: Daunorubicin/doxorubicin resistance ATP-binding protein DrrA [candidate division WS6 bacterium OLB20]|uniref:Daunorubicin/doxorubicin resistance ATP-binding protein DrrA n=1 Tax=candidate division WS6 bacterium OLB20 TaxID=1617426 RepID=A0A136LZD0_9BACT|nr:MAG: Daunorubicin/doxorubicin resistance ATP-binding protein DrrA [candidate division WS6 bacterium OLB20]